ncbi:pyridoxine 5'-phosphate oxidase C-terminal domain-containing protein [Paenibacillus dakarensis]|uniref:pyridoxine 5'-phosphate oxidase C-terminal domain-containing protein n=1 Tax=Paenibacillus dakarensis TaxID=1527293 RepID=UPI0006D56E6A|nr:pyridoxine 5'-phosphate oxidase C-terminal domain-containing protein [Paenibacillus dakarensis]
MKRGTVAKAIALIERQSQILVDPTELEDNLQEKLNEHMIKPEFVSSTWTFYQVNAREVEFWQANEDRKHTRLLYKLNGDRWTKNTLWP